MIRAEYVRSLNCNYERIMLEKKPEENRYQYCILSRGGIKGLLPCGLRYINGEAYLYYDISSKQNVAQMYSNRSIGREWLLDFMWSAKQMQGELERFLLDAENVLWDPEQIYQDMESKVFFFLYIPYYEGEDGFAKMMNFLIEHIDYEDELLVECVYYMYEQMERNGKAYFQEKIFEDVKRLEKEEQEEVLAEGDEFDRAMQTVESEADSFEYSKAELRKREYSKGSWHKGELQEESENSKWEAEDRGEASGRESRRGFLGIFESKKQRNKRFREEYRTSMQRAVAGYAVAEESAYEAEEYGRTMYIEEKELPGIRAYRLYDVKGELLTTVENKMLTIGKQKEEVDLPLNDPSVSRLHARIVPEGGEMYLEDLNSTNGTFKNGLRLRPYEKRKLDAGDEIKCGKVILMFRL